MICPFDAKCSKEDNPCFDNTTAHAVLTITKEGHTHIHAPFDNKIDLFKMVDALLYQMEAQGINYFQMKKQAEQPRFYDKKLIIEEGDVVNG